MFCEHCDHLCEPDDLCEDCGTYVCSQCRMSDTEEAGFVGHDSSDHGFCGYEESDHGFCGYEESD